MVIVRGSNALVSFLGSRIPWRCELALPHTDFAFLGNGLIHSIGSFRVSRPIKGMTGSHKPGLNTSAVGQETVADESTVAIPFDELAPHRTGGGKECVEGIHCCLPAPIVPPAGAFTELPALGCIDPIEADTLSGNLDGVTVDH